MKPTIRDIAKLARVSKSTVSRVINKSGPVSSKTREMVLNAISALKYKPNEIARSLVLKRTKTICLIVQDIRNPYHSHACWYAERVFRNSGYSTIICNADHDLSLEKYYLDAMKYRNVDGILCIGGDRDVTNIIVFHSNEDLPMVLVDREVRGSNISTVTLDNVYGGGLVVDYLFSLGHLRIAFATSDYTEAERRRLEGYILAHKKRSFEPDDTLIISQGEEMWYSGECPPLMELLKNKNRPTAIFASNDYKALQVMRILKKKGIQIPDEISVVGYDDIELTSMLHPALTTVHQPIDRMIEAGADILIKLMQGKIDTYVQKVMKPWLVERESTRRISLRKASS